MTSENEKKDDPIAKGSWFSDQLRRRYELSRRSFYRAIILIAIFGSITVLRYIFSR
jgi:hypothetical protein